MAVKKSEAETVFKVHIKGLDLPTAVLNSVASAMHSAAETTLLKHKMAPSGIVLSKSDDRKIPHRPRRRRNRG